VSTRTRAGRGLAVAAVVLAVLDAVLFAVWLRDDAAAPAALAPMDAPAPPSGSATAAGATAVRAAGGGDASPHPASRPAGATAAAAGAAAPPAALLLGTVRAADGQLVAKGALLASGEHAAASTAIADGTFTLRVQPGTYVLRTRVEDALPLEHTLDVHAPHTRVDLQLATPWRLLVYARTPDGRPLLDAARERMQGQRWFRGLCALAFPEALPGDLPPSNRDEYPAGLGRFRGADVHRTENVLPKDSVGLLVLPPDRPLHVALLMRNAVIAQQLVLPGTPELTFTLPVDALLARTATVRARVVDAAGAPVAGARVALNDANASGGGVLSDADGRVTLRHLKPGLLNLEVRAKGHAFPPVQVPVTSGAELDLGDLVTRAPASARLSFEGGDGPVSLRVAPLPPFPDAAWRARAQWLTAAETLPLPAGRYGVLATRGELCALVEVEAAAPPPPPVAVALVPGASLRVRVRAAPAVARVTVRSARGAPVFDEEVLEPADLSVRVPPGSYEAEVTIGNGPAARRVVTVGADGAVLDVP
jgi:hypothetical protein